MWLWAVLGLASAAPMQWESEPYVQPILNARVVSINGNTSAQALGGAEVGLQYTQHPVGKKGRLLPPKLLGRTRLQGIGMYGLSSQSLGFEARLGSFIGPTGKVATYQVGPDFWLNQYGSTSAIDYYLPLSAGVDLRNAVFVRVADGFGLQAGLTPGWAFNPQRQGGVLMVGDTALIHELTASAAAVVNVGEFRLTVGYQRHWTAVGVFDGLILSGSL